MLQHFQCAVNSEVYIDKTGLLEYTNKVLGTNARFICNSRPRRFGKSVTVDMLTAYYSKGCDTEKNVFRTGNQQMSGFLRTFKINMMSFVLMYNGAVYQQVPVRI